MFPRSSLVCLLTALITFAHSPAAFGQPASGGGPPTSSELRNGNLEQWNPGGEVTAWLLGGRNAGRLQSEATHPAEGQWCAKIDATSGSEESFTNLMQVIVAESYRGKTIRYRAAVRTGELAPSARVQLWCRVDRKPDASGQPQIGAFDNMQNRPIVSEDWKHFEIVLPIADDAERINLGIFVTGQGVAWFDTASLEPVTNARSTELKLPELSRGPSSIPPILAKALTDAANAPPQSFFTPWLLLAAFAIVLSMLAMLGPLPVPRSPDGVTSGAIHDLGRVRRFALRFAVAYWGLYYLDHMVSAVPWIGLKLRQWHTVVNSRLAHELAHRAFGIEGELVPPNGSGDTTYSYLSLLAIFSVAMAGAALWSVVDRRRTDYAPTRDLLRSYLRYALALSMLGYGLAKVTLEMNQFPQISSYQLDKTWGATSPMGVLWTFMGVSRPYTIFAGLGEVAAAVLLIWRRTTVLGAMIAFGVMLNVMMLNYCYDVPVKIYSTHLVVTALMIMMPEAQRLLNVLVLNRAAPAIALSGIWGNGRLAWARAAIKLLLIAYLFALPLGMQSWRVARQLAAAARAEAATAGSADPAAGSPPAKQYLLTSRGFRWINEVPFNR